MNNIIKILELFEAKEKQKSYRSWDYWFDPLAPKSGQWKARYSNGITMNTNTEEGIKSMIDKKMYKPNSLL